MTIMPRAMASLEAEERSRLQMQLAVLLGEDHVPPPTPRPPRCGFSIGGTTGGVSTVHIAIGGAAFVLE
jgi:hypothetical protein